MTFNLQKYLDGATNNNNNYKNVLQAGRRMIPDTILIKHGLIRDEKRKIICCRHCKKLVKFCFCTERPYDNMVVKKTLTLNMDRPSICLGCRGVLDDNGKKACDGNTMGIFENCRKLELQHRLKRGEMAKRVEDKFTIKQEAEQSASQLNKMRATLVDNTDTVIDLTESQNDNSQTSGKDTTNEMEFMKNRNPVLQKFLDSLTNNHQDQYNTLQSPSEFETPKSPVSTDKFSTDNQNEIPNKKLRLNYQVQNDNQIEDDDYTRTEIKHSGFVLDYESKDKTEDKTNQTKLAEKVIKLELENMELKKELFSKNQEIRELKRALSHAVQLNSLQQVLIDPHNKESSKKPDILN